MGMDCADITTKINSSGFRPDKMWTISFDGKSAKV